MTIAIVLAITEILGLFLIGAFARRRGYIGDNEIDRMSRLTLDFLLPAFTFTSITRGLDAGRLHELWILPVAGFLQVPFFALAGAALQRGLLQRNSDKNRTFIHLCAVNNSTFLPAIILRNLMGEEAIAHLFLLYLGIGIGVWTIGVEVFGVRSLKQSLQGILRPNLVAIFAACIVVLTGAAHGIPKIAMNVLESAGSVTIPLIMVLTGASLAHRGTLRITWPIAYITIVRLLVLPILLIPLLALLPVSSDIYTVTVIVALMPTAISSVVMARRYGGQHDYAASAALLSTLCSIVTVPLAVWLLFGKG
jgi:malate permease and related proteins